MAKASDNPFPSMLLVEGSAPASPAAGDQRVFLDSADHKLKRVDSGGTVTTVEGGGGGSLTTQTSALAADVTMTNANQYYDGPTISLAAGTWLLVGTISFINSAGGGLLTAKLWDGTTAFNSGDTDPGASQRGSVALTWIVSPGTTTTYKISGACPNTGATIKAAVPVNSAGNNASVLVALKVA